MPARNPHFHYHYVTAREMYNLARAAEAGWTGSVAEARDYELVWQPAAAERLVDARNGPESGSLLSQRNISRVNGIETALVPGEVGRAEQRCKPRATFLA